MLNLLIKCPFYNGTKQVILLLKGLSSSDENDKVFNLSILIGKQTDL